MSCAALALAGLDCAGGLEDPGRFTDGGTQEDCPDDVVESILVPSCGRAGCHAAGAVGLPDLVTADVRDRLTDVPALSCGGVALISSADPGASALLGRVTGDCGSIMPPASDPPLSDQDIACLAAWLEEASP